ncbi:MAG: hypothetical protein K9G76_03335 [Bacteroidales bacterium]|nr:hypothetical protein [Bacteroidales bacterium]MCF8402826.1 hypothetical protein [Bacteroidales bacterium]
MKKFTKFILSLVFIIFITSTASSQNTIEIAGQLRPRYEMRNGYSSLMPEGEQASSFISQRTRLNFNFSNDMFKVGFSLQNVSVWGEKSTLSSASNNGNMLNEAWGQMIFSKKLSLKVGRQQIVYDDHRIFGSVDWAQQSRRHDAAILMIKPHEDCQIDFGVAYNAMKESNFKEYYMLNNYKALQYLHWNRKFNDFGVSLLILNNGLPYRDFSDTTSSGKVKEKIAYSQTLGTRLSYGNENIKSNAAFYYQTGKITSDTSGDGIMESTKKISGLYLAADVNFALGELFTLGAGFEYLSGNSMKEPSDKDEAFKPLYGTNHKFNGFMDYFYVGNHMSSVGLIDVYLPIKFKKDKFTVQLIPHIFSSAAQVYGLDENGTMKDFDNILGTELDLALAYKFNESVTFSAGYSQMIATETMEIIKSQPRPENLNNWAWVMIDIKPTFFKSNKDN